MHSIGDSAKSFFAFFSVWWFYGFVWRLWFGLAFFQNMEQHRPPRNPTPFKSGTDLCGSVSSIQCVYHTVRCCWLLVACNKQSEKRDTWCCASLDALDRYPHGCFIEKIHAGRKNEQLVVVYQVCCAYSSSCCVVVVGSLGISWLCAQGLTISLPVLHLS